jgi:hypothetical protein
MGEAYYHVISGGGKLMNIAENKNRRLYDIILYPSVCFRIHVEQSIVLLSIILCSRLLLHTYATLIIFLHHVRINILHRKQVILVRHFSSVPILLRENT